MNWKWKAKYNHPQSWTFEIEREVMRNSVNNEKFVGFYLRAFDAEGEQHFDYLQEELEIAQEQAEDKWGVPMDCWVITETGSDPLPLNGNAPTFTRKA